MNEVKTGAWGSVDGVDHSVLTPADADDSDSTGLDHEVHLQDGSAMLKAVHYVILDIRVLGCGPKAPSPRPTPKTR